MYVRKRGRYKGKPYQKVKPPPQIKVWAWTDGEWGEFVYNDNFGRLLQERVAELKYFSALKARETL